MRHGLSRGPIGSREAPAASWMEADGVALVLRAQKDARLRELEQHWQQRGHDVSLRRPHCQTPP